MKNLTLIVVCLAAFAVVGCQPTDVGNSNVQPLTQEQVAEQIKKLEADPNISPQEKAMRKGMLERNGSGQKSMSTPQPSAPAGQ